jgi:hypothetical protein
MGGRAAAIGLATTLVASAGCSKSPVHAAPLDASGFFDALPNPDAYVDPLLCGAFQCNSPPCCGMPCSNGQCCKGTICGASGTCIPESCQFCGDVGCNIDTAGCTASCATPTCCLGPCASAGDCCPGTRCQADSMGIQKCVPSACDGCTGWESVCHVDPQSCGTTCTTPTGCGADCSLGQPCGEGTTCYTFGDGAKECVPASFQVRCNACGSGCLFYPGRCGFDCESPDGGPSDGPLGLDAAPALDGGACAACCQSCGANLPPCCPGSSCGMAQSGQAICVPDACLSCDNGCTYSCPPS